MGHSVIYQTFPENTKPETMYAERAMYIEDNGERNRGILMSNDSGFKLHNVICDSYDEAVEKIAEYDNGWYDDHGVKFYNLAEVKPTKQMENLRARRRELLEKKQEYIGQNGIQKRTSDTIKCPKCGSRLALAYMNGNHCPLCETDLRSNTVLNKIKWYDEKIKECDKKYAELEKKQKSKAKIYWLVKLEFHV